MYQNGEELGNTNDYTVLTRLDFAFNMHAKNNYQVLTMNILVAYERTSTILAVN